MLNMELSLEHLLVAFKTVSVNSTYRLCPSVKSLRGRVLSRESEEVGIFHLHGAQ